MAATFITSKPNSLLAEFNKRIEQTEAEGKITTWERSDDKEYYTHKSQEWRYKAWFKPKIENEKLIFNIIKPKNEKISTVVYGYYHGHIIETFLNHFDKAFSKAEAAAMPINGDRCS
jgi:hypothetical protein